MHGSLEDKETMAKTFVAEKSKRKCLDCESNTGPSDLQSDALPTELSRQI
jgi:hypothetical protein